MHDCWRMGGNQKQRHACMACSSKQSGTNTRMQDNFRRVGRRTVHGDSSKAFIRPSIHSLQLVEFRADVLLATHAGQAEPSL